jgi:hypothetical protein
MKNQLQERQKDAPSVVDWAGSSWLIFLRLKQRNDGDHEHVNQKATTEWIGEIWQKQRKMINKKGNKQKTVEFN